MCLLSMDWMSPLQLFSLEGSGREEKEKGEGAIFNNFQSDEDGKAEAAAL